MKKKLLTLLTAAVLLPVMASPLPSAPEEEQHECTSWIVMPDLTGGKYMYYTTF